MCDVGVIVCGVGVEVCDVGVIVCGIGVEVCDVGVIVCGIGVEVCDVRVRRLRSNGRCKRLREQQMPSPRPWKVIRYFHSTVRNPS